MKSEEGDADVDPEQRHLRDAIEQDCIFLDSTINPFKIVARQKGIEMLVRNSVLHGSCLVSVDENKVQIRH